MNVDGEFQVRLAIFAAIFTAMSVWEVVAARRERRLSRRRRWTSNGNVSLPPKIDRSLRWLLVTLLTLPFRRSTGSYPLGRREPTSEPGEESPTRS